MLPGGPARRHHHTWIPEYIRRLVSYHQMDLEYTFWMMFYLCFNPSRVYKTTTYHKQTKNQWARDDPAFVAILICFLFVASVAYAVAFRVTPFYNVVKLMFWAVFIDFIGLGAFIATIGYWISNKYLRIRTSVHNVEQSVEWLYAFDIHCNSFFPVFLILYVFQFFLIPIIMQPPIWATFLSNTLYLIAFAYYYHITFLGYHALPFLQKTECFLYPIGLLVVAYVVSLIVNFNASMFVMKIYFSVLPNTT